ncbi:MAG: metallophosphoesterase family protein [Methyloceanibacter sp.]|uniref:metallophosphoesterase family protein n=1 Tax=Methyloceanibacter sp. TaxID=1965321 RepID=UPI003D6CFDB9
MRLLLVSDFHYSLPLFDWVVEVAGDFDVVVMAGDHLDLASIVDGRAQSVVVQKYFNKLQAKTRLLICSGNHDLDAKNAAGEKVARWLLGDRNKGVLSDGDSLAVGDTLFTMCPWWDGPVSRAAIGEQFAKAAALRQARWIWIYHAPPADSPVAWAGQRHFGDAELRRWIETFQPDIVMSGHVHEAPYVKDGSWVDRIGSTWIFNTGHYLGAPPAHIIMDTEAGEALWLSAAGNQYVRLDGELERPVPKLQAIPGWLKAADQPPAPGQG